MSFKGFCKSRAIGTRASSISVPTVAIALILQPLSAFADPVLQPSGSPCEPAHVGPSVGVLPSEWRAALDELVNATSGTTRPWDCSGAELSLTPVATGMILNVKLPDGRHISRSVPSPDLLKPTGEAVLAAPTLGAPPSPTKEPELPAKTEASPIERAPEKPTTTPLPARPRLIFDIAASARYSHPPNALWAGGAFRVTVPFGPWSGAAWARFALPADVIDRVPSDFSITEVSIGVAFGRALLMKPVELRLSLDTSAAVVSMEGGDGPATVDGSRTDFRLGPDLQATWTFARVGRYFVGTDFEVGPADLAHAQRVRPTLPPLPAFTTGLSTGIGLGIL